MNILVYVERFYPHIGGMESRVRRISECLHGMGEQVVVVTETGEHGEETMPFRIVRQPDKKTLREMIVENDIIYMNGFNAYIFFWTKLKRKKIVMAYFDLTPICPKGTKWKGDQPCVDNASLRLCVSCLGASGELKIIRRLFRPIFKSILSLFIDENVCNSRFGFLRFPLWRKRHINNGIDTKKYIEKANYHVDSLPLVLFVGRLIPDKGCQVLLQALATCVKSYVPIRLGICGDGPYRPKLEELIQKNNLDSIVEFYGSLIGKDLIETYRKADIVVIPSLIDEPFGNVAIEAMSCGLPVIASNVGGLGGIVSEAGFTFERGDSQALASIITRLVNDPRLRETIGHKARNLAVDKYDWRIMADRYHRLFVSLLDGKSS